MNTLGNEKKVKKTTKTMKTTKPRKSRSTVIKYIWSSFTYYTPGKNTADTRISADFVLDRLHMRLDNTGTLVETRRETIAGVHRDADASVRAWYDDGKEVRTAHGMEFTPDGIDWLDQVLAADHIKLPAELFHASYQL